VRCREYDISIEFSYRLIKKVIVDSHYEEKHADSISDQIYIGVVNAYRR